jgi:hypothetical protein
MGVLFSCSGLYWVVVYTCTTFKRLQQSNIFLSCSKHQGIPLHTPPPTVAGTRPPVGPKAARLQAPPLALACGTPLQATHRPALPPPGGTPRGTLRPATEEPRAASAKTAGTKPPRRSARPPGTGVDGPTPPAQTVETSRWGRRPPQAPVRGSRVGTRRPPVRWDPQPQCSPRGRRPLEHRP